MTPTTTSSTCRKCRKPLATNARFCTNCGTDTGFSPSEASLGGTISIEQDPNPDTLAQLLSEATLGDYDIYGELGRGGMAAVYLALDMALNRKVAIKTMLPELVSREGMVPRFKREAQTAASLSHPHIIQIFTVKETPRLVYFVMKFIEGRSLESVIIEKGGVDVDMARVILSQVGGALAFAHRKNVIHRDVKPANIMLDEDGWAIVTDFGIAKVQEAQNLTATGTAIGTPHYMSPEQFHNKAVTGASDQYSLGIVAYEMLAGKKPFDGATYAEIITQHLFEPPPDIRKVRPDVPAHVAETIMRMLDKDPAKRFQDLDAAVTALGTAQLTQGDALRTQMISIAKSGPQKKVRMSVPISPIPVGKKPAAGATAIEAVRSVAEPKKSRTGLWVGLGGGLVAAVVAGYFVVLPMLASKAPPQSPAAQSDSSPAVSGQTSQFPAPATPVSAPDTSVRTVSKVPDSSAADKAAAAKAAQGKQKALDDKKAKDAAAKATDKPTSVATAEKTAQANTAAAPPPATVPAPPPAAPPAAAKPTTAFVKIGSRTPAAVLFNHNSAVGLVDAVKLFELKGGAVSLSIRAAGCANWDSTFAIAGGDTITIGRRNLTCTP